MPIGFDRDGRRADTVPSRRLQGRFAFFCLLGFIATQGFLVPVIPLSPLNWAVWPSFPDLFGAGMVLGVFRERTRVQMSFFDRKVLRKLVLMEVLYASNLLFVTIPVSSTGDGIRFGGFTLVLLAKYILVFWAAAQIPLNGRRIRWIHRAALFAFLWLTITTLASKFGLLDLGLFTHHLPGDGVLGPHGSNLAGKWNPSKDLDSTVSNNHGTTSVALMVIGALVIMTKRGVTWFMEILVFVLGGTVAFIAGSRQGVVRMATFAGAYLLPHPRRMYLLVTVFLPLLVVAYLGIDSTVVTDHVAFRSSIDRQMVLWTDPLTNEALAGRPMLWSSVIETLNEHPIRWVIGYGIGNYVEFKNAAHNMVLMLLQDGGLVFLVVVTALWVGIWRQVWAIRKHAWTAVALFVGLLSSSMTSGIFYPNLATGWYLGLFFIVLHIQSSLVPAPEPPLKKKQHRVGIPAPRPGSLRREDRSAGPDVESEA